MCAPWRDPFVVKMIEYVNDEWYFPFFFLFYSRLFLFDYIVIVVNMLFLCVGRSTPEEKLDNIDPPKIKSYYIGNAIPWYDVSRGSEKSLITDQKDVGLWPSHKVDDNNREAEKNRKLSFRCMAASGNESAQKYTWLIFFGIRSILLLLLSLFFRSSESKSWMAQ